MTILRVSEGHYNYMEGEWKRGEVGEILTCGMCIRLHGL